MKSQVGDHFSNLSTTERRNLKNSDTLWGGHNILLAEIHRRYSFPSYRVTEATVDGKKKKIPK